MTKKPPPGRPFKKGASGNPGGRPKLTDEERALKNLTREQFAEVANILLTKTNEQLQMILSNPETPALMEWIIKVILIASERGDFITLNQVLDRLIGKVPDKTESMNLLLIERLNTYKTMSTEQLMELAHGAIEGLKAHE